MTRHALSVDPDAPLCPSGKRPYRTEAEALRHAGAVLRSEHRGDRNDSRPEARGRAKLPTKCAACGWYHLFTAPGTRGKPRRGDLDRLKDARGRGRKRKGSRR